MKILTGSLVVYKNNLVILKAVVESLPKDNFKLVVVDNSPTDSLREFFSAVANVEYVHLESNVGFGKGHNIAFERVKVQSEVHFIINPDIYCDSSVFLNIASKMRGDDTIGLLGPKILYPSNKLQYSCRLLPTPLDLIIRRIPIKAFKAWYFQTNELPVGVYEKMLEVPFVLGCFIVVKPALFDEVGGFDERFYMYLEDVDLCRKIQKTHRVVYYPEVIVYHHYAKGSRTNFKLFLIHLQSVISYFFKWGWFVDKERGRINKRALANLKKQG